MYEIASGGASIGASTDLTVHTITVTTGTITVSTPAFASTQTWNAGGVTFAGLQFSITDTASATGSHAILVNKDGSVWFSIAKNNIAAFSGIPCISSTTQSYRGCIWLVPGGIGFSRGTSQTLAVYAGADITSGVTGVLVVSANSGSGNKGKIGITASDPFQAEPDIFLCRQAAGIFGVQATTTTGGSFSHTQAVTNISANTDNLILSATRFQKLNCTSACNLTGIAPPSGSHVDGREIVIINSGTQTLTLKHNTTSTAANRMFASTGADIALAPNQRVVLTYDGTDNGSGAAGFRCTAAS